LAKASLFQVLISIHALSIILKNRILQVCPWINAALGIENSLAAKVCYGAGNTSEGLKMKRGISMVFEKYIKKAESLAWVPI